MNAYDPLKAPDPEAWLALDEMERMHGRDVRPRRKDLFSGAAAVS